MEAFPGTSKYNQERTRILNQAPIREDKSFVLYWMQAYRRLSSNHSLDYAVSEARRLNKSLVVYEGLRIDYPWASERIHRFILEGMVDNFAEAKKLGISYYAYVETPDNPAKGILKKLSEESALIVTDDFPCFIIPEQIARLSEKSQSRLVAVDGNGIIPLNLYGSFASAARILRTRIHKLFPEAYIHQAKSNWKKKDFESLKAPKNFQPPFQAIEPTKENIEKTLASIPFPNDVPSYPRVKGGRKEALKILAHFLSTKLLRYGTERSQPDSPDRVSSSTLSPYLHFGHIGVEEVIRAVLDCSVDSGKWAPDLLNPDFRGKREGFFSNLNSVNSYLDELITWRDTGFQWFWQKPEFGKGLSELPNWAKDTLALHKKDKREYHYTREEWALGKTHDPIWNSAQNELRITGRMHNYMRMLWGKKIIEWSGSYEEAFSLMEELNNLYAYDGRNPNSYTGILWCFGMFDRPWYPERNVLGVIRYMSSDSTKKKFKLASYLDYVDSLTEKQGSLF